MKDDDLIKEKEALGSRIQNLRVNTIDPKTQKQISQEELALRSNVSEKTIGEIERGETNPKLETLLMIARGLKTSIKELFNY